MGKNLGGHSDGDPLGALGEQERETDRKLGRLLVASVIGCHPVGDLRVEDDLLREFAQPRLDVTRSGVAVAGEDVAPVSLAVYQKTFLTELDKGSKDGLVAVRVVLHSLTDYVGHLGVASVIHPEHCVKHAPLNRLQSVNDVRDSSLQNDIRGIVQKPFPEHSRKLVLPAVGTEQLVVFPRCFRRSIVDRSLIQFLVPVASFRSLDVIPLVFSHT